MISAASTEVVIFVVGPTASGKSALALDLALEFGGSILNCDSLQICRRLDVGSAKPSLDERARVPHYLFDELDPGQRLTAGDFRRRALAALAHAAPRGPVFAVGGSGFYIQALEKGLFDVAPPRPEVEARVRARVRAAGPDGAYAELVKADPEYARELNPQDVYRVTRALIMIEDSGQTVSRLRAAFTPAPFPYPRLKLGLDPARDQLAARIARRTARMLDDGLIDETRALLHEGFRDWPALASVGYRETVMFLNGEIPRDELAPLIELRTRQLAKRQRTWFRRDGDIQWLDPAEASAEARSRVRGFLDAPATPQ